MLSRPATRFASAARSFSTSRPANFKVAVLGAAGGIGQPLSLLLKASPRVTELSLYDVANAPGVAADLSHIPTKAAVTGFEGDDLDAAVEGCDLVLIPAGVPRKPGMTRDDLFATNASIMLKLSDAIARKSPKSLIAVIANPVNSLVPIASVALAKHGVDNNRLFGVTTLDLLRAQAFVAAEANLPVETVDIPVIGGHAGTTILPLLSQFPSANLSEEAIKDLSHRIQFGGDAVVKAKNGTGSATLSMAMAAARFAESALRALDGDDNVVECTYVESTVAGDDCPFFASPVKLGKEGIAEILPLPKLSAFEQAGFDEMKPALVSQINKGLEWAKANSA